MATRGPPPAIVLHIGERSETLLPRDGAARARAIQWLVAALNSIEPFVMNVAIIGRPGFKRALEAQLDDFGKGS